MGEGRLAPPRSELLSDFYSRRADRLDLWWRNMLENPSLVQLEHRILAGTSFISILAFAVYARASRHFWPRLAGGSRMALRGMVGMACLQVTLGIATLMHLVPIPLASAHQAGALALFASLIAFRRLAWGRLYAGRRSRPFNTPLSRRILSERSSMRVIREYR